MYVYLHNIAGNDVYLVPEENLNFLLKNELSGDCVGIGAKHCGIREVRTAGRGEEAFRARSEDKTGAAPWNRQDTGRK